MNPAPASTHPQVMVVDDDATIRNTVRWVLEQEGCSVALASEGGEALAQLQRGLRPGMILLDLTMPSMGGEQFMRHCREIPGLNDIPVYLFTATPGASDKAAELGAAGCLPKPIRLEQLLALVERHAPAP
jgi:two-component system, chemotaxis family, chemotaxis protein CheY